MSRQQEGNGIAGAKAEETSVEAGSAIGDVPVARKMGGCGVCATTAVVNAG